MKTAKKMKTGIQEMKITTQTVVIARVHQLALLTNFVHILQQTQKPRSSPTHSSWTNPNAEGVPRYAPVSGNDSSSSFPSVPKLFYSPSNSSSDSEISTGEIFSFDYNVINDLTDDSWDTSYQ